MAADLQFEESTKPMKATGIILAGGKSARLGRNKAIELIGDVPLIERVINRLSPITNKLILVTFRNNNIFSEYKNLKIVNDIYPNKGPLSGIYTGLCFSNTVANIIVACDMPAFTGFRCQGPVPITPLLVARFFKQAATAYSYRAISRPTANRISGRN